MYGTWATGFATSLSLILAIGAQNAFVLREGLARQHVFWLCLFCGASDAVLIATGVAGFGATTALWPAMPRVLAVGGAVFLFVYGTSRFLAAYRGDHRLHISGRSASLGATLAVAAAFTWGNPHVACHLGYAWPFGRDICVSGRDTGGRGRVHLGLRMSISIRLAFWARYLRLTRAALNGLSGSARSWPRSSFSLRWAMAHGCWPRLCRHRAHGSCWM